MAPSFCASPSSGFSPDETLGTLNASCCFGSHSFAFPGNNMAHPDPSLETINVSFLFEQPISEETARLIFQEIWPKQKMALYADGPNLTLMAEEVMWEEAVDVMDEFMEHWRLRGNRRSLTLVSSAKRSHSILKS